MTVLEEVLNYFKQGILSKDSTIKLLRDFDLKKWEIEAINNVLKYEHKG